jgi:hypothetical protein
VSKRATELRLLFADKKTDQSFAMKRPTEFDYLKAWLLFFLIAAVIGGAIGMVIGSAVGAVLSARGMPVPKLAIVLQIVGLIIAMPISYLTFRLVVGKYLFPKISKEDNALPVI